MPEFMRRLGNTDLHVSGLGLGTVKLGRNTGVKYPQGFPLPDDDQFLELLACARELGINLLDTAPAYGTSEERLGRLMGNRHDWVLCTKTGEEYANDTSAFDFGAAHTRMSVERSLKRLGTDYLDLVLIHSDGNDLEILEKSDCVDELESCRREGLIRHIGMSTKTDEGGIRAAELLDVVMLTWNLQQQDTGALEKARTLNKGVLVKKGLMSGHASAGSSGVEPSLANIFKQTGIHSAIVGTLNSAHLRENCAIARRIIGKL